MLFSIDRLRTVLRFPARLFHEMTRFLREDIEREQFAFLLARPVQTADGLLLLVQQLFLPDPDDLAVQTAVRVEPSPHFQALVYLVAQQTGCAILDVHTHVAGGQPVFSSVDIEAAGENAHYIVDRFAAQVSLGIVVFNRTLDAHDALFFDRAESRFAPIDAIEVIDWPLDIRRTSVPAEMARPDERYARQYLVPGWNQAALAALRIGIVGAGGNGAQCLQTLASIGIGAGGWIACIDPDRVEASNLPRIPYATSDDVGRAKVDVAGDFARSKNPAAMFYPLACLVTDPAALHRLKACDVLFGCGDNDGVRLVLNNLAIRFGIPLIDLGADIQISADTVEAGGQVRVVVPGVTGCLVCSNGIDHGQAAIDLLDNADRAIFAQRGYVMGGAELASTPSVSVLNALATQYAVTALLSLLECGPFKRFEYVLFDWLNCRLVSATAARRPDCLACGDQGLLFSGLDIATAQPSTEPSWELVERVPDQLHPLTTTQDVD